MKDNDLIQLFLPIINAGLVTLGYTGVVVKQTYEPTQQGVNTVPTVYFYKLFDHRYGFRKASDKWDEVNSEMVHTEEQKYETTFQISALVIQDPANISYTASDLVNDVAAIMQSVATINTLEAQGVGIYRVTEVRNPYFTDDKDRNEASPSFDFTLTHTQTIVSTVPVIETTEFGIYRV